MQISKTEYMLYLRHPAWLWIKKHAKGLIPPVNDVLQARFDEGHAFEPFAEALFPDLIRLGFNNYSEYLEMPTKTVEAWKNGAKVVAQGRYEGDSITCIADILRKEDDAFILTEIKSSSSVKKEHKLDLAFQKIVLEGAGYEIKKCEVAHVDSSYIRKGDIKPDELVAFTDITQDVENLIEGTRARIEQALLIANSEEMPDPAPEKARLNSYGDWLDIRQKISPPLPETSIHFLPYMDAERSSRLLSEGIKTVEEISDLTLLKKSTQNYLSAKAAGKRAVEQNKLSAFLSEISYPIYYFDYETSKSLLPPWDGTRPHQQVPFQYSLHILREPDGELEHCEYLHRDLSNPMLGVIESLRENVGDEGSILVWYEPFEKKRNSEMAEIYPEAANFLNSINDRIIDLMMPFSQNIVRDPAFMGSSSIKKVLPVLVPDLSYESLDIQEGETAALKWKKVTFGETTEAEKAKVYADLIEYCKLDTLAMVEIHKQLKNLLD